MIAKVVIPVTCMVDIGALKNETVQRTIDNAKKAATDLVNEAIHKAVGTMSLGHPLSVEIHDR